MKALIRFSVAVAVNTLLAGAALAATCYEDVYIPEIASCSGKAGGAFADFTSGGCTYTPARIERQEKDCPIGWYNVPETTHRGPKNYTHAELCATHGMRPATTPTGMICASGESRARDGERLDQIHYKYGIDWDHRVNGGDHWIDNHISGETVCGWANEREKEDAVIAVYCQQ